MSGASVRMPPQQKMQNLFDSITTGGSASITKAQFEQAFKTMNPPPGFQQLGADAVWAKLDPKGTGSVSKGDFVSKMTTLSTHLHGHHHHHGGGAQPAAQDPTETVGSSLGAITSLGSATGNIVNTKA